MPFNLFSCCKARNRFRERKTDEIDNDTFSENQRKNSEKLSYENELENLRNENEEFKVERKRLLNIIEKALDSQKTTLTLVQGENFTQINWSECSIESSNVNSYVANQNKCPTYEELEASNERLTSRLENMK